MWWLERRIKDFERRVQTKLGGTEAAARRMEIVIVDLLDDAATHPTRPPSSDDPAGG